MRSPRLDAQFRVKGSFATITRRNSPMTSISRTGRGRANPTPSTSSVPREIASTMERLPNTTHAHSVLDTAPLGPNVHRVGWALWYLTLSESLPKRNHGIRGLEQRNGYGNDSKCTWSLLRIRGSSRSTFTTPS